MIIYIVILHYKDIKDTITCLDSIDKLKKSNISIKTIVVNNNSKVLSIRHLQTYSSSGSEKFSLRSNNKTFREIRIIQNSHNLGFAGGMNIGIEEALKDKDTDYILILNNDTILPKNFLEKILDNPSDITSPVIKFKFNNKWIYDYGGNVNWLIGRTKHLESAKYPYSSSDPPASGESRSLLNSSRQARTIRNIDYVSGCSMLVKREVFEKIGLFDDRFFFYFEDVDFCVRAVKSGFKISVCNNTVIYHRLGGSIGRWSNKAILYNLYGNLLFITKHLGFRRPLGYLYLFMLAVKILFNQIIGFRLKQ